MIFPRGRIVPISGSQNAFAVGILAKVAEPRSSAGVL
jgi:hypothetical protein